MILLASQSSGRLATLRAAGVEPLVRVSDVDEHAILRALAADSRTEPTPPQQVQALARAKAADVADTVTRSEREADPDLIVVGCDSMLEINGQMQGKPHTPDVARERIRAMRRMTATLWTGHSVALLSPASSAPGTKPSARTIKAQLTRCASTQVHFGDISDQEIDAYVATGEPLQVAGSFTVDGLGGPFIEGVTGDYHLVVGISLPLLRSMVTELGLFWPDLWDTPRP